MQKLIIWLIALTLLCAACTPSDQIPTQMTPTITMLPTDKSISAIATETLEMILPTNTKVLPSSNLNDHGRIYVFDESYGYLDPQTPSQILMKMILTNPPGTLNPSGNSISLAFSYYSQQVAYITLETEFPHLWVGSIDLSELNLSWVDNQGLLNFNPDNEDEIKMQWGLNDNFITLANRENILLFSVRDESIVKLSGLCNWITVSPRTNQLSVLCPIAGEKESYLVLEKDGSNWLTPSLPVNYIQAMDWIFSPSADKVLYATKQNKLMIVDKTLNQISLPVNYIPPRWDTTMRNLQWSQDGKRLLVYADDRDTISWLVLDSETGKFIWSPQGNLKYSDFDATLSPNGQQIVMFLMEPPDRYGYVVSLNTGEKTHIYIDIVNAVSWGK